MFKGIFKKASIYFDTTPTKGSSNAVTSDGIARAIESGGGGSSYDDTELRNRITTAESDIDDIQAVIPSNASSSNKLATAIDIPDTSSFATASDLQAVSGRVTTAESDIDGMQELIPSNASTSNKLATASDIPDTSSFATASDLQTLSGRVTTAESDIDDIQAVIPSNASSSNKLATMSDISGGSDIFNLDSLPLWNGDGDIGNLSPSTPPTAGRYRIIKSGAVNAIGFIDVLKNTGLNKIILHTIFYDSNLTAWEYCRGGNISGNTVTWQTIKKATWGNA